MLFFAHAWDYLIICNSYCSYFITIYLLPVNTEMNFQDKTWKKKIPEITDLLRYWLMLEIYGRPQFKCYVP